jgi:hypothetical protein
MPLGDHQLPDPLGEQLTLQGRHGLLWRIGVVQMRRYWRCGISLHFILGSPCNKAWRQRGSRGVEELLAPCVQSICANKDKTARPSTGPNGVSHSMQRGFQSGGLSASTAM